MLSSEICKFFVIAFFRESLADACCNCRMRDRELLFISMSGSIEMTGESSGDWCVHFCLTSLVRLTFSRAVRPAERFSTFLHDCCRHADAVIWHSRERTLQSSPPRIRMWGQRPSIILDVTFDFGPHISGVAGVELSCRSFLWGRSARSSPRACVPTLSYCGVE